MSVPDEKVSHDKLILPRSWLLTQQTVIREYDDSSSGYFAAHKRQVLHLPQPGTGKRYFPMPLFFFSNELPRRRVGFCCIMSCISARTPALRTQGLTWPRYDRIRLP